jgi:outer membrane protein assembly factor BamB
MSTSSRFYTINIRRSCIIFVVCLTLFLTANSLVLAAGASITLTPTSGPPKSNVTVNGTGFGAGEQVSLTFDTMNVGTATTTSSGTFSHKITVPSSALPGTHTVTAVGQSSGLSASASFLVQTDWIMFGYNAQHTHLNPSENVISPSNASGLTLDWSYNSSGGFDESSATLSKGILYIGSSDTNVYAFDAKTGAKQWSFRTSNGVQSSPAVVNGVVYIGSFDWNLYALNAQSGTQLWSFKTNGFVNSSPVVANGVVYISSQDHNLYALNAGTGAKLWSYTTGNEVHCSPSVADGVVYVTSNDHNLYAFHLPGHSI